jgi:hypothetical protein
LRAELQALQKARADLQTALTVAQTENAVLQRDRTVLQALRAEHAALQREHGTLQAEHVSVKRELKATEAVHAELKTANVLVAALQTEKTSLTADLSRERKNQAAAPLPRDTLVSFFHDTGVRVYGAPALLTLLLRDKGAESWTVDISMST